MIPPSKRGRTSKSSAVPVDCRHGVVGRDVRPRRPSHLDCPGRSVRRLDHDKMKRRMTAQSPLALLTVLLITPLAALCAAEFSFDAPAGPQFPDEQKQAQREAGARIVPLVLEAFRGGADSVRIPPRDYRFGKERWGRDGVIYPLEFADLQRDDAHPFTIDATGATFWFDLPDDQAPTCHFCIGFKNCRNIIFKGATIDRATRGHVEGRITQFDFAGNRIELQLSSRHQRAGDVQRQTRTACHPVQSRRHVLRAALRAPTRRRPSQVQAHLARHRRRPLLGHDGRHEVARHHPRHRACSASATVSPASTLSLPRWNSFAARS